jgi:hypothetical protein
MPTRTPDLSAVLERWRAALLRDLHVAFPAQVTAYDAAAQTVDVQPLVADYFEEEDDSVSQVYLPVIPAVRLLFPGAGGYRITFPLQVGDVVQILVNDRSLDAWADQGGKQAPEDLRRHALQDAVALPGLHDTKHPWTGARSDGLTLGQDGGPQISTTATAIELGGNAYAVALAEQVVSQLNALKTAIQGWTPISGDGGAALKTALTALFASWPGTVGSGTVKVSG